MNKSKNIVFAVFLMACLLSVASLDSAITAEPEVAGAGSITEPTPTPTPSVSVSPVPSVSPTPMPTVSASPAPTISEGGLLEWVTANLLWLGIAALVIIIASIYLSRRRRDTGASPVQ